MEEEPSLPTEEQEHVEAPDSEQHADAQKRAHEPETDEERLRRRAYQAQLGKRTVHGMGFVRHPQDY